MPTPLQPPLTIHHCADTEAVARFAADAVITTAAEAIAARGVCHLALAGGTTPKRCYDMLCDAPIDWRHLHIWFGDERCLPAGDPERNDQMADDALIHHIPIPPAQVHRIAAELGAEAAAERYAAALTTELTAAPAMDLLLLGIGEDGHTASLFPDNPALMDTRLAVPVHHAPKPPADRVSMGYSALHAARRTLILVAGHGKAYAMQRILAGAPLPAARVEQSEWVIDRAAWPETD